MIDRTTRIRIIADDLTGAADAAAPLATPGAPATVSLSPDAFAGATIASFDADLRDAPDEVARDRTTAIARVLRSEPAGDVLRFQKIDSMARGHVARDVSLMLDAMPDLVGAVIAPAFPAQRRFFRGACVVADPPPAGQANLQAQFAWRGRSAAVLSDLSGGPEAVRARIAKALTSGADVVLADSGSQGDLATLAAALLPERDRLLFVGSAGLTAALAGDTGWQGMPPPVSPGRLTFVIGTQSPASRDQLEALVAREGVQRHSRTPEGWDALKDAREIRAALRPAGGAGATVFDIRGPAGPGGETRRAPAQSLARSLGPHIGEFGTLVLSGGDTARALLEAAGVSSFEVLGSIEPGICLCRAAELPSLFVTKSGGFGDRMTLVRLSQSLQRTESAA